MPIMSDYLLARQNMIDSQLRPNRVLEAALIEAFQAVPREFFVPERLKGAAYIDEDIALGQGRYLLAPLTIGRLLQAASIAKREAVLVAAGATGYGAALAGKLARTVTMVEPDAKLAAQARAALRRAGLQNVSVFEGPVDAGYAARGPFDVVILEGAVDTVPPALLEQLAPSGRLATVLLSQDEAGLVAPDIAVMGRAVLMTRSTTADRTQILFETGTQDIPGLGARPAFVF